MKIEQTQIDELNRICMESFQRNFSETELQEIAQRIIRFLKNTEGFPAPLSHDVDPD